MGNKRLLNAEGILKLLMREWQLAHEQELANTRMWYDRLLLRDKHEGTKGRFIVADSRAKTIKNRQSSLNILKRLDPRKRDQEVKDGAFRPNFDDVCRKKVPGFTPCFRCRFRSSWLWSSVSLIHTKWVPTHF